MNFVKSIVSCRVNVMDMRNGIFDIDVVSRVVFGESVGVMIFRIMFQVFVIDGVVIRCIEFMVYWFVGIQLVVGYVDNGVCFV